MPTLEMMFERDAKITALKAENDALRARIAELEAHGDHCDYHEGYEEGWKYGSLDLETNSSEDRKRLLALIDSGCCIEPFEDYWSVGHFADDNDTWICKGRGSTWEEAVDNFRDNQEKERAAIAAIAQTEEEKE